MEENYSEETVATLETLLHYNWVKFDKGTWPYFNPGFEYRIVPISPPQIFGNASFYATHASSDSISVSVSNLGSLWINYENVGIGITGLSKALYDDGSGSDACEIDCLLFIRSQ